MSPLICCVCAIFCAVVSGAAETGPAIRHCDRYGDVLDCSGISAPDQLLEANASYANVKHLAIRRSNITFKHDLTKHFPNVRNVTMSGTLVNCAEDVLWLLGWRDKVSDPDDVLCMGQPARSVKKAFKILGLIQYSNDHCPKRCNCTLYHVPYDRNNVTIKDDPMNAHVAVSCGNLGLTELPRVLPENVTSILLDVSNNKIEDVSELATSAVYSKVRAINLTNNLITSVAKLEGSQWMENAKMLNLQGNRLREMPIHGMNRSRNHTDDTGYRIFLAGNPWRCDCFTVTNFQKFVAQTKELIKDAKNVTCGPDEGESAGLQIKEIELLTVCMAGDNIMKMAMDGLNVFLALVTVVTVGKLLYDFYAYRKTGQLPWLASKLP